MASPTDLKRGQPAQVIEDPHAAAHDPITHTEARSTRRASVGEFKRKAYKIDTADVYDVDESVPATPSDCNLCGAVVYHAPSQCPVVCSLGALRTRIALVESKVHAARDDPKDGPYWRELLWQLNRWSVIVERRKQDAMAEDTTTDNVPYGKYDAICEVPDKFWTLNLWRRGRGEPDSRRIAVGMHPYWPWYPPPPEADRNWRYVQEAVQFGYAKDDDRADYDRLKAAAAYWERGVHNFLRRRAAEEQEITDREREAQEGPELSAKALKVLNNDLRAMVDPLAFARDLHKDADLPSLVRHVKWTAAVKFEYDGGDLPNGQELWLYSTADWYCPPPSLRPRVLRLDGTFGEHEYSELPQWHVRGKFYRAFCEGAFYADFSTRRHKKHDGDFAWYDIVWSDFRQEHAVDGSILYKMSESLVTSMDIAFDMLWEQAQFWRSAHRNAQDYPFEAAEQLLCIMRTLRAHAMDEREMRQHVVGCQREMKDIRGWVRWHRSLNRLLKLKVHLEETGMQVAPRADPESVEDGLMQVCGLWTTDMHMGMLASQAGAPSWVLLGMPKGHVSDLPVLRFIVPLLEQRRFADATAVPTYVLPIRQQPSTAHLVDEGSAIPDDFDTGGDVDDMALEDDIGMTVRKQRAYIAPASSTVAAVDCEPGELPDYDEQSDQILGTSSMAPATTSSANVTSRKRSLSPPSTQEPTSKRQRTNKKLQSGTTTQSGSRPPRAKKVTRVATVAKAAEWWAPSYEPAHRAAKAVDLSAERLATLSSRKDRPVPVKKMQVYAMHYRAPGISLFGQRATKATESKMFRNYIALLPHIRFSLEKDAMGIQTAGMTTENWRSMLKGFTDDVYPLSGGGKVVFPERALWWARQVGVEQLLLEQPKVIVEPVVPLNKTLGDVVNSMPTAPYDEDDEDDYFITPPVPSVAGSYFVMRAPEGMRPLASERHRGLYMPSGFYLKGVGQRREYKAHAFWVETPCSDVYEDVFEFQRVQTGEVDATLRSGEHDVWVDFEHADVYLLDKMAEPDGSAAVGERMFNTAVRQFSRQNHAFKLERTREHVRVWHHYDYDLSRPLEMAPELLGEIGSKLPRGTRYQLPPDVMQKIIDRGGYKFVLPAAGPDTPQSPEANIPAVPPPESGSTELAAVDEVIELVKHKVTGELSSTATARCMRDILDGISHNLQWDGEPLPPYNPPSSSESKEERDRYDWLPDSKKREIGVQIQTEAVRLAIMHTDVKLCDLYPDHPAMFESRSERSERINAIWGGSYSTAGRDPLTSLNRVHRARALRAFHSLLVTWPTDLVLPPFPQDAEDNSVSLANIEEMIWMVWSQTYADYFRRAPPVPMVPTV